MGMRIALKKGVVILIIGILFQFGCTRSSQDTADSPAVPAQTVNRDCFAGFTRVIASKIVNFYQEIEAAGNWREWGIDENEKKIKIWVLPPGADFEDSVEILHKTSANLARVRLNQFIENSLGSELEKQNARAMVQVVGNSEKTVDQLVGLISSKYSSKVYENDVYREIGNLSMANFVMKVSIITGDTPVIAAYLQSIEKGLKQCFSGNISIATESCPQNIRRQFQLLQENPNPANKAANYSKDYFKKEVSQFADSRLKEYRGAAVFIDRFSKDSHNRLNESVNFNHLEYIFDLILAGISHSGDYTVYSARDMLNVRGSVERERGKLRQASKILISPGISWIKRQGRGLRFEVSLALTLDNNTLIAQNTFTLDLEYDNNLVRLCEVIEGDKNKFQNRLAARLRIYKKAALRVAGVFYVYNQMNGDEARDFFSGEAGVRFNNAAFNEGVEGDSLCIDIDVNRIYNTYSAGRK